VATRSELEARAGGPIPLSQPVRSSPVVPSAASAAPPAFTIGSTVIVRNVHPLGHTRCPRYVRGKRGVVARADGRFPLPDVAAHAGDRCDQYTYSVRFAAQELWGTAAESDVAVYVDLWESYLEAP
jgi:hypothetical protein